MAKSARVHLALDAPEADKALLGVYGGRGAEGRVGRGATPGRFSSPMSSGSESEPGAFPATGRDRWADDEDLAEESRRARKRQRKEKKAKKAKKKAKKAHKRRDRAGSPGAVAPAGPQVAESAAAEEYGAAMPPQGPVGDYGYPSAEEVLDQAHQAASAPAPEPEPAAAEAAATDLVHRSMLHGCRSVEAYEKLKTIDEGTYGVVHKARCRDSGEIVALKQARLQAAQWPWSASPVPRHSP